MIKWLLDIVALALAMGLLLSLLIAIVAWRVRPGLHGQPFGKFLRGHQPRRVVRAMAYAEGDI